MEPYSQDLRIRILQALEEGQSVTTVAEQFKVSSITVLRYQQRLKKTGACLPLKRGNPTSSLLAPYQEKIMEWIAQQPDLTLAELIPRIKEELGISMAKTRLSEHLRRWSLRFKKKRFARPNSSERIFKKRGSLGKSLVNNGRLRA
jgi:transposase